MVDRSEQPQARRDTDHYVAVNELEKSHSKEMKSTLSKRNEAVIDRKRLRYIAFAAPRREIGEWAGATASVRPVNIPTSKVCTRGNEKETRPEHVCASKFPLRHRCRHTGGAEVFYSPVETCARRRDREPPTLRIVPPKTHSSPAIG